MQVNRYLLPLGVFLLVAVIAVMTLTSAQDNGAPPATDDDGALIAARLDAIPFRPLEDIVDQELIITNFADDGTASLPLETSVPVACTIVWGPAPDNFTHLSLDLDMDGGTHSTHNPLLRDLEAETTYYFRVQGVDDNGVIYLSDVMTFTTPAFAATEAENLLAPERGAQVIGVSSNFGGQPNDGTWGVLNAFDGNARTAWSSSGDGDSAWFEVELAERSRIDRVEFWTRFMSDGSARIASFTISTEEGETFGPFELPDAEQTYSFDVDIVAERLRFEVASSTGGNTGAVEVAVYGAPVNDNT